MRWLLLACALLVAGCGSPGTFPLYVTNQSNAPLVVSGAGPDKQTLKPGGHACIAVPRDEGTVVKLEGGDGPETFTVGRGITQGGPEPIFFLYGTPPGPLWTAAVTDLKSKDGPTVSDVQPLGEGRVFEFPEKTQLILPSQPFSSATSGPQVNIIALPSAIKDATAATPYIQREMQLKLEAQKKKSLPPAPRR